MNEEKIKIIEYLVKQLSRKGAEDAVVSLTKNRNTQLKFVNNKIASNNEWNAIDAGIFASFNKKIITTSLKNFTKPTVDETVRKMVSFSKNAKPNKDYFGIAQGPYKYKEVEDGYDKKIVALEEKSVGVVENSISAALEEGAERCSGVLETHNFETLLLTTGGVKASDRGTDIYFSIRSFAGKEASGHTVRVSRMLKHFNPEKASRESAQIAVEAKNPSSLPAGKYDVVFAQLPFANLAEHLGAGASIFSVESGLSCLKDKLGKKIASERFNLTDDGTLKNGIFSSKFDAEGVPTQKNQIIREGVLKTYLHNTSTARKYKTKTTGNAGLVSPSPHNLIIEKGEMDKEELFKEVKKGIYVTNTWYTRFQNYSIGDFSTLPRDGCFIIENGEIKSSIKNTRISENLLNIMANIRYLSSDSLAIKGWEVETPVILPHVLVKEVNITKPE